MQQSKTKLILPVQYTQQELDEKRDRISAAMLEFDAVEESKKTATSQFSENLKALRGEVRKLAKDIRRKGEDRAVECLVEFHKPSPAFKTITRTDTGELVKTEAMSYEESQANLFEETEEIQRLFDAPDNRPTDTPTQEDERPPAA